jgi:hypothetical protein
MSDVEQGADLERERSEGKGRGLLIALAILCSLAVAVASLRHTGSLAFPIDDSYIYSNYVLSASYGEPFTYNSGELSGGITGIGWYLLTFIVYLLLAPFHAFLGSLGPPSFRQDMDISRQAGHLYLAAYLVGAACLAVTALGVRRLIELSLPTESGKNRMRQLFAWLLGAVAAADLGLVWGAMSGLESTFAAALVAWAAATLIAEGREGRLRWSLLLVALLPLARPDLTAIGAAGVVWLLARLILSTRGPGSDILSTAMIVLAYFAALAGGLGAMSFVYYLGWGNPLPSSFYAKVGGLRLGDRFFSAVRELLLAGRYLPFIVATSAVLGALVPWLPRRWKTKNYESRITGNSSTAHTAWMEYRFTSLYLLLSSAAYIVAILLSLPWFGQEDRYLLPIHPLLIVLCGLLAWRLVGALSVDRVLASRLARPVGATVVMLLMVLTSYLWATRNYAVEVRNISDAHIAPAKWIAQNTPPLSIIASEPIGAVKLFSGRRTVDLVGLTTPATLGTYRDWPRAWEALRKAGAGYLLFYPRWFDGGRPPPWAVEEARFSIPDNRIAGDDLIAVYRLEWPVYNLK